MPLSQTAEFVQVPRIGISNSRRAHMGPLAAGEPLNALVTGANRGLGPEIVRIILRHAGPGTRVFLGCRDLEQGKEVAHSLSRGTAGGQVIGSSRVPSPV